MLPTLTWIDFSERDRRKMLDVVSLFTETGTRDELGIASVRDAVSETLFPGTSTIMTRGKYFLFVPWLFRRRERIVQRAGRHTAKNSVARLCRRDEVYIIQALVRGGEQRGVVGIDARERLQRMPSSIYWAGLRSWGIRRFSGGIGEYQRHLQHFRWQDHQVVHDDDDQPVGDVEGGHWHPGLPEPPEDFLTESNFELRHEDALFLKERILGAQPGTLLAHLVDRDDGLDLSTIPYPWLHPDLNDFPPRIQAQLEHAKLFAILMHGASLLYNLMIAEDARRILDLDRADEWITQHTEGWAEWASVVATDMPELSSWDLDALWTIPAEAGVRVNAATRSFVERWVALVRAAPRPADLAQDEDARALVRSREHRLKRSRARLGNPRRLELFSGSAGLGVLSYRWPTARTIVADIRVGIEQPVADA